MATDRPATRASDRRRQAGFTLIEMLLALTLMAAVFAAIGGAVSFSGQAMRSGQEKIEDAEGLLLIHRLLRQSVSQSYALPADEEPDGPIAFEGTEDRLLLVASLPPYPAAAGLYEVEFEIESKAAESELWLRRGLYRPGDGNDDRSEPSERFLIYRGARNLAFSYYGSGEGASSDPEWQEVWDERARLPKLVRLTFDGRDDGAGGWPDIVVRPRSSPAAVCVQLSALPYCQQERQP